MSSPAGPRRWTPEEKKELLSHILDKCLHVSAATFKEYSEKSDRTTKQIDCQWNQVLKPELYKSVGLVCPTFPSRSPKKSKAAKRGADDAVDSPSKNGKRAKQGPVKADSSDLDG